MSIKASPGFDRFRSGELWLGAFCTATRESVRDRITMNTTPLFQIVVPQLKPSATRHEFIELHRQTSEWMKAHAECFAYEVYKGRKGAIADRIT